VKGYPERQLLAAVAAGLVTVVPLMLVAAYTGADITLARQDQYLSGLLGLLLIASMLWWIAGPVICRASLPSLPRFLAFGLPIVILIACAFSLFQGWLTRSWTFESAEDLAARIILAVLLTVPSLAAGTVWWWIAVKPGRSRL
jgi:hypothetical protein